jgi:N-acetylglucosamine-6-phosphate deacetylase
MADGRYRLGPLDVTVHHSVARLSRENDPESAPIAGGTSSVLDWYAAQ